MTRPHAYAITYEKIDACLQHLADSIRLEGRRGDMRPMLLREAARIVAARRAVEPDRFAPNDRSTAEVLESASSTGDEP